MGLINTDAFKREISAYAIANNIAPNKALALCEIIDKQPTIDAEPVRHGRWIPTKERNIWDEFCEVFKCSECGKFTSHDLGIMVQHRYCPNCGAKMDGESEVQE